LEPVDPEANLLPQQSGDLQTATFHDWTVTLKQAPTVLGRAWDMFWSGTLSEWDRPESPKQRMDSSPGPLLADLPSGNVSFAILKQSAHVWIMLNIDNVTYSFVQFDLVHANGTYWESDVVEIEWTCKISIEDPSFFGFGPLFFGTGFVKNLLLY
jgi:hypothetical protein